jgi:hypothetical protein
MTDQTTDAQRRVVKAIDTMDDETFLKHWHKSHAMPSRILSDETLSVEKVRPEVFVSVRRYHERLHDSRYYNRRLGPGDPGHDHRNHVEDEL